MAKQFSNVNFFIAETCINIYLQSKIFRAHFLSAIGVKFTRLATARTRIQIGTNPSGRDAGQTPLLLRCPFRRDVLGEGTAQWSVPTTSGRDVGAPDKPISVREQLWCVGAHNGDNLCPFSDGPFY